MLLTWKRSPQAWQPESVGVSRTRSANTYAILPFGTRERRHQVQQARCWRRELQKLEVEVELPHGFFLPCSLAFRHEFLGFLPPTAIRSTISDTSYVHNDEPCFKTVGDSSDARS